MLNFEGNVPKRSTSKKSVSPCYPEVFTKCLGNLLTVGKTVTAEVSVPPHHWYIENRECSIRMAANHIREIFL